jgi:TfoX/Sxy family transcriptional regulator of competence genes
LTLAYDEELADRIRELLAGDSDVTERKLFGGLAFLVGGHMAIAASRQGGALLRVDPSEADRLVDRTHAEVAIMRNRPMQGWLRVAPEHLRTKRQLAKWVDLSTTYARSLPRRT